MVARLGARPILGPQMMPGPVSSSMAMQLQSYCSYSMLGQLWPIQKKRYAFRDLPSVLEWLLVIPKGGKGTQWFLTWIVDINNRSFNNFNNMNSPLTT